MQVQNFKNVGVSKNKKGYKFKDIVNEICKGRQIIGCLNSLWWDKNISLDTKGRLGKAVVESVACYGCEVWLLKTEEQTKLLTLEMDYLRRSAGVSRLQKIPNITIRSQMQAEQSIFRQNSKKAIQMAWTRHTMYDSRWMKIYQWISHGRMRRGRPQRSWKN